MTAALGQLVLKHVGAARRRSRDLDTLLCSVSSEGDVVLVGGAPRDWFLGRAPRDLDIVVEASAATLDRVVARWSRKRTRYGGHRLSIDGLSVDIWSLHSTWAFTVHETVMARLENLPQTAFYNVDALAVSAVSGTVFEHGFSAAFQTRMLSTVFEANPFPALCAVRGLVLAKQYGLRLGTPVLSYIDRLIARGATWDDLDAAQVSHYGERRIMPMHAWSMLSESMCASLKLEAARPRKRHTLRR